MGKAIENLQVLQTAEILADNIWEQVSQWGDFARDTVGKQLTRAVDSVGANISEAFGSYHYGEKLQFLYYARGSVFETKYWLNRVHKRSLIPEKDVVMFVQSTGNLAKQLNGFLGHIKRQRQEKPAKELSALRDEPAEYLYLQEDGTDLFTPEDVLFILELDPNASITNNK